MEVVVNVASFLKFPFYNFMSSFIIRMCLGYLTLKHKPIQCKSSNPVSGSAGLIGVLLYISEFLLESTCLGIGTIIARRYNFTWNLSNYYVVPLYSLVSWPAVYMICNKHTK